MDEGRVHRFDFMKASLLCTKHSVSETLSRKIATAVGAVAICLSVHAQTVPGNQPPPGVKSQCVGTTVPATRTRAAAIAELKKINPEIATSMGIH